MKSIFLFIGVLFLSRNVSAQEKAGAALMASQYPKDEVIFSDSLLKYPSTIEVIAGASFELDKYYIEKDKKSSRELILKRIAKRLGSKYDEQIDKISNPVLKIKGKARKSKKDRNQFMMVEIDYPENLKMIDYKKSMSKNEYKMKQALVVVDRVNYARKMGLELRKKLDKMYKSKGSYRITIDPEKFYVGRKFKSADEIIESMFPQTKNSVEERTKQYVDNIKKIENNRSPIEAKSEIKKSTYDKNRESIDPSNNTVNKSSDESNENPVSSW